MIINNSINNLDEINNELLRLENYNKNNNKSNAKKIKHLSRCITEELRTNLNELLVEINTIILNGYLYSQILKIIIKYLSLLSSKNNDKEITEIYNQWINTPYIFFPTYQSINFQTVISLISAPIINFRLSNRARSVHRQYVIPMYDVNHDIMVHALKTHKFRVSDYYKISFKKYFTIMNEILKLLYPYYYCINCTNATDKTQYDLSPLPYNALTENNKKNSISLLLFTVMHEMISSDFVSFKPYIYNLDDTKKAQIVAELQKEVSNNMFDRKYPFVKNLDWNTVVAAFANIIDKLNEDNNKYNNLVNELD